VRNYRIVVGIGICGDVEILLDDTTPVGQERPVGVNTATIFIRFNIRFNYVVGADRDKSAIANLALTMKLDKPSAWRRSFGAVTSAVENQNHWLLALQFGELTALRSMVGKLKVGNDSSRSDIDRS
jgi:hypothetical protein